MPTRRELLGAGAAAGLALWLPSAARAAPRRVSTDVAIVGGGLAGLTCALRLAQAGRSVAVLEARDRVGGRTLTHTFDDDSVIDAGGESIGPTQGRVSGLVGELGLELFETRSDQTSQLLLGRRIPYAANAEPDDPDYLAAGDALGKLDAMARDVPPGAAWRAPQAGAWARATLASFRDGAHDSDAARGVFDLAMRTALGSDPEEVSLLTALAVVAGAGDPATPGSAGRLVATIAAQDTDRVVGGAQSIAQEIAAKLSGRVFRGAPVRAITRRRDRVIVDGGRVEVHAHRVVVAIPPALAPDIAYIPRLPRGKVQVLRSFRPGALRKWQAVYDQPFWRDGGLSGGGFSGARPAQVAFDNTPLEGAPGVLAGFAGGSDARAFTKAKLLAGLAQAFGERARQPTAFLETDWTRERWSAGSPMAWMPGSALIASGPALRVPYGLVHFAGSEYAAYWPGYMDGAVRSGEDAALEVQLAFERARTGD